MTDAGWAAGKDIKEPGWYWWDEKGLPIKAVQIEKGFTFSKYAGIGRDVMYVVGYGGLLEDKPGRFLGPLSPDTYHQGRVAGLKYAAIICRERGKPHDIEWWNTASKKEISRQTAMDCAELIEQQAQRGEK